MLAFSRAVHPLTKLLVVPSSEDYLCSIMLGATNGSQFTIDSQEIVVGLVFPATDTEPTAPNLVREIHHRAQHYYTRLLLKQCRDIHGERFIKIIQTPLQCVFLYSKR